MLTQLNNSFKEHSMKIKESKTKILVNSKHANDNN